jgi:hypothetical protein
MVDGCLDRYEYGITEFLYGAPPMSASVDAVAALEDFGLMKIYSDRSPGSDYDDDRVVRYGDGVLLTSAGEGAAAELAQLGLTGVRLADWTEAGKRFLAENMRELDAWEQEITAEADRKRKVAANLVAWTNRVAFVASIAALGVFLGWIRITVFN